MEPPLIREQALPLQMSNEGQVAEAALDKMVEKVVMESFASWRSEQRQVMR
eukprot:CAMPEP_0180808138 /NCGR_PEP_ID=MMETSP1038_2-20121128/63634_1 /TAXON_ID=632150 /ORGANISM="Azadinium spinosum, Strain 3D9" /LENGTH=50 /DNA_ID=CAMNT_0022849227 /DNA_START=30 /DNA_END=178 /DNA_ORIENTATION=-